MSGLRAAQYVRMSTDHQRYSIDNQMSAIKNYALAHKIEIVRTYADEGRSGLKLKGRDALTRLLADVQNGTTDYNAILVYDVSRWGRFQNTDESAYYEFICKLANIDVIYCAEQFQNDGSAVATLLKAIKRVMAGEYSRELSVKVVRAHRQQAALGFHQGGPANYGLRRAIMGTDRKVKLVMQHHEAKSLQTDRVVLVRGPDHEVATIREIFRLFVDERLSFEEIAGHLNQQGVHTARGNRWRKDNISLVLRCEKYAGTFVFGMTRWPLLGGSVAVPQQNWIRVENAVEPVIDRQTFAAAQLFLKDGPHFSDNDLLDFLSAAWCVLGLLSAPRLNACKFAPTHHTYLARFGGLTAAYERIGYRQIDTHRYTHAPDFIRLLHRKLVGDLVCLSRSLTFDCERNVLRIGDHKRVAVVVLQRLPCRGRLRAGWALHFNNLEDCDSILIARMDARNIDILDFHLIPRSRFTSPRVRFTEMSIKRFRRYRLTGISSIVRASRRIRARRTGERHIRNCRARRLPYG